MGLDRILAAREFCAGERYSSWVDGAGWRRDGGEDYAFWLRAGFCVDGKHAVQGLSEGARNDERHWSRNTGRDSAGSSTA